jgi:hypothetical protein
LGIDALEAVVGLVVQRVDLPAGEVSWTVLDDEYAVVRPGRLIGSWRI